MSQRFDNHSREQSPATPLSASGPSGSISYQANVNRTKTKKWAEAKPVDYGADWGEDYDDDDEYEPPPPPLPKTVTGLRQPGQNIQTNPTSPIERKAYGDLPAVSIDNPRNVTSPVRERANSFDRGDERRAFSNSQPEQQAAPISPQETPFVAPIFQPAPLVPTASSPHNFAQPSLHLKTNTSVKGLRKPLPPKQAPGEVQSAGPVETPLSGSSSKYSQDTAGHPTGFQSRRDFSPVSSPSPLQTRTNTMSSQVQNDSPAARFPPRESSVGHLSQSDTSDRGSVPQDTNAPKPWTDSRSSTPSSPGPAPKPTDAPAKALPFIRPADIYKRHLEEQKEKERQSLESSRPSMDSIARASERSSSPAIAATRKPTSQEIGARTAKPLQAMEAEDQPDSGRRLVSNLEPVKERTSEHGFESYRAPEETYPSHYAEESRDSFDHTDEEQEPLEPPRFTTSPKLPDLNRMSGFGMDMFAQSSPEETRGISPTSATTLHQSSTIDTSLRSQPSLGFTSAVQQAFDTQLSPSIDTSESNRDIRRTNSESTGTTGISPIMSRVPSLATGPDRREIERDISTPAIAEDEEPGSTRASMDEPENSHQVESRPTTVTKPVFHPGHRRDISTPSPGNSPARTPAVSISQLPIGVESARYGAASPPLQQTELDLPAPPRPFAEREQSFRPQLPGSWQSYATSASTTTTGQDVHESQRDTTQAVVSPVKEQRDEEAELEPTTSTHHLPTSAPGAVGAVGLGGAAVADIYSREISMTPPTRNTISNSGLPTPDPALAPTGNPYSSSEVDSRLGAPRAGIHAGNAQPFPSQSAANEFQQAVDPRSTQQPLSAPSGLSLQPPSPEYEAALSSAEGTPPPPPAKDTPAGGQQEPVEEEYFPPTVPLKPKSPFQSSMNEQLPPLRRPEILPTLSTNTSPQDQESDKLRKEIIKSLSPRTSQFGPREMPSVSYGLEDDVVPGGARQSTYGGGRESTYLPSEYEGYWASTDEPEPPLPHHRGDEHVEEPHSAVSAMSSNPPFGIQVPQETSAPEELRVTEKDVQTPPVPPPSAWRVDAPVSDTRLSEARPPLGNNRFSWEGTEAPLSAQELKEKNMAEPLSREEHPISPAEAQIPQNSVDIPNSHDKDIIKPLNNQHHSASPTPSDQSSQADDKILESTGRDTDHHGEEAAAIGAGGVAALAAASFAHNAKLEEVNFPNAQAPQRRLSLAEEKSGIHASAYPVSETPPEDQHPAKSQQSLNSPVDASARSLSPQNMTVTQPTQQPHRQSAQSASNFSQIMQFKEIMAMNSSDQRIKAYNQSRDEFAMMNTGLAEWLVHQKDQPLELGSWSSAPANSASARQGKPSPILQQPYYQQYLNASSPTATTPPPMRPNTSPMNQPPSSMSGTKSSSQQMQNKSKELLTSAGKFGGLASKAGKGLLAKGKNKLRAAAGDKNSTSPELNATPTPERASRRASWGIPLGLTRSTGRSDSSFPVSREATPSRDQGPPHLDLGSLPTSTLSFTADSDPRGSRSSLAGSMPLAQVDTSEHSDQSVGNGTENHTRDTLGPPAPIGKFQPSWDPFNATPIVEESDFFDSPPRSRAAEIVKHESLAPPAVTAAGKVGPAGEPRTSDVSKSDVSKSDVSKSDVGSSEVFHDAPEGPADDWVMVPSEGPPSQSNAQRTVHAGNPEPFPTRAAAEAHQQAVDPRNTQHPALFMSSNPNNIQGPLPPQSAAQAIQQAIDPRNPQQPMPFMASTRDFAQNRPPQPSVITSQPERHPAEQFASPSTLHFSPGDSAVFTSSDVPPPANMIPNDAARSGTFVGLPPIRRSSTFDIESGPKKPKQRFSLTNSANKGETGQRNPVTSNENTIQETPVVIDAAVASAVAATVHHQLSNDSVQSENMDTSHGSERPALVQMSSSVYSQPSPQNTAVPYGQISGRQLSNNSIQADSNISEHSSRIVPDQTVRQPYAQITPSHQRGISPDSRESLPPRAISAGSQNPILSPVSQMSDRPQFPRGAAPQKPFEQPPSSAQRYPGLFRPEQLGNPAVTTDAELPHQYYQAPISREEAFLPRSQNEYQLPGVGPPVDSQLEKQTRRNSGFFKDITGKLSRTASRDRSASRDRGGTAASEGRQFIPSEDGNNERSEKRISKMFGGLGRTSTAPVSGLDYATPPQSRTGTMMSMSGARPDFTQGQFQPQQPSPLAVQDRDRKRSMFGGSSSSPVSSLNSGAPGLSKGRFSKMEFSGLGRTNTRESLTNADESLAVGGKKKRFSGISSMFGRSSVDGKTIQQPTSQNQQRMGPVQEQRQQFGQQQGLSQTRMQDSQFQNKQPFSPGEIRGQSQSPQNNPQPTGFGPLNGPSPGWVLREGGPPDIQRSQGPLGPSGQQSPQGLQSGPPTQRFQGPQVQGPSTPGGSVPQMLQDPGSRPTQALSPPPPMSQRVPPQPGPQAGPVTPQNQFPQDRLVQNGGAVGPQYGTPSPNLQGQPSSQSQVSSGPSNQQFQNGQAPGQILGPQQISQQGRPTPQGQQLPGQLKTEQLNTNGPALQYGPRATMQNRPPPQGQSPGAIQNGALPGHQYASQQGRPLQQGQPVHPQSQQQQMQGSNLFVSPGQRQGMPNPLRSSPSPQGRVPQGQQGQPLQNRVPQIGPQGQHAPPDGSTSAQKGGFLSKMTQKINTPQKVMPQKQEGIKQDKRRTSDMGMFGGLFGKKPADQNVNRPQNAGPVPQGTQTQQQLHPQPMQNPRQAPMSTGNRQSLNRNAPPLQTQNLPKQEQLQQQQLRSPDGGVNISRAPDRRQSQDRGRPQFKEPQYEQQPIPGGYGFVRGEGSFVAPGGYGNAPQQFDPRYSQLGQQPSQYGLPHQQFQGQQVQGEQFQGQQLVQHPQQTLAPYAPAQVRPDQTRGPSFGSPGPPVQQNATLNKHTRPLSSEDVLARSPARQQPGQQAPYQLSLPKDDVERGDNGPEPPSKNPGRVMGNPVHMTQPPAPRFQDRNSQITAPINTQSNPALRHPGSPATYPLPESMFSPINPAASQEPAPPAPPMEALGRSNTINTHMSEISQLSSSITPPPGSMEVRNRGLSVPMKSPNSGGRGSIESLTPPSESGATPQRVASPPHPRMDSVSDIESSQSQRGRNDSVVSPPSSESGLLSRYGRRETSIAEEPHASLQQAGAISEGEDDIYDVTPETKAAHIIPMPSQMQASDASSSTGANRTGRLYNPDLLARSGSKEAPISRFNTNHTVVPAVEVKESAESRQSKETMLSEPKALSRDLGLEIPRPGSGVSAVTDYEEGSSKDKGQMKGVSSVSPPRNSVQSRNLFENPDAVHRHAIAQNENTVVEEKEVWHGGPDGSRFVGPGAYGSGAAFAVELDADPTPMMSATSYPGMEWNPYGMGAFDDID